MKRRSGVSAKRRDGVARKEEGLYLMGHKFTLRGATSAFYQQGPDSVTGTIVCRLAIGPFKVVNC